MTDSLFQCYTQSILTASLKRREINLPKVTQQIPSNLKNLFLWCTNKYYQISMSASFN